MRSRKQQRPLHLGPPQVEVAMLQPQLLVRHVLRIGVRRYGRREALVEQLERGDAELDLAGRQLRIRHAGGPLGDSPRDLNHVLRAQRLALLDDGRRRIGRIEHHLRHAVPVAQIDEQPAAMIAVGIDPAAKRYFLADMFTAQVAAGVGSQHENPLNRGNLAIVMALALLS